MRSIQQCHLPVSVRFLLSVHFTLILLFLEFLVLHEYVIKETGGRSGQARKAGFLLLFWLCFEVR